MLWLRALLMEQEKTYFTTFTSLLGIMLRRFSALAMDRMWYQLYTSKIWEGELMQNHLKFSQYIPLAQAIHTQPDVL